VISITVVDTVAVRAAPAEPGQRHVPGLDPNQL
jgi:hypothetical protein